MSEISRISINNVKEFDGHEGELLVICDILVDGSKVGSYEMLDWGGSPEFTFVGDSEETKFSEVTRILLGDRDDWYMRGLTVMHELISEYLDEKYGDE